MSAPASAARRSAEPASDAFVLFGATGDLAFKKIFPALDSVATLDMPVIGIAPAGLGRHLRCTGAARQPRAHRRRRRAGASRGCSRCCATWTATTAIRQRTSACEGAGRRDAPRTTSRSRRAVRARVQSLVAAGLASDARVIVEKPFGRDLASARRAQRDAHAVFAESTIFRIDHYLGKEAVRTSCTSASPTPCSSRCGTAITSTACRSRWPRTSASGRAAPSTRKSAPCATWSRTTCCRSLRCSRWRRRVPRLRDVHAEKAGSSARCGR